MVIGFRLMNSEIIDQIGKNTICMCKLSILKE